MGDFFIVLLLFLNIFMAIGSLICLGLATYNDAKARMVDSPAMWGWLVALFGLIPGIIYLCTRNSVRNRIYPCLNCGFPIAGSMPSCPRCRAFNFYAGSLFSPQAQEFGRKAKSFLIWAIVLFVLSFILMFLVIGLAVSYENSYTSFYYRYY